MKIPYPGDLNSIETAVWATEYVRVRADFTKQGPVNGLDIYRAVDHANRAVADLRAAKGLP